MNIVSVFRMKTTLGLDFGTNSVRSLIVDCSDGSERATFVAPYPSGKDGVLLDPRDSHLARQHPGDYIECMELCIRQALETAAKEVEGFEPASVVAIGVDTTGSSPLPVNDKNQALGTLPPWKENLNAQCWLWKDHTSHEEAATITSLARRERPHYVAKCGNTYSSEWFWSKIGHCANVAPEVFEAAHSWVELSDWIPSLLAGVTDPQKVVRGVCAAGHKALYAEDWNGLPDEEFLTFIDPRLAELRGRLYEKAYDASHRAGRLCKEWAERTGLTEGIPITVGEFDVHYGAIGCGIGEGTLVKVIGTSTCDCAVVRADREVADIPGICGIVNGAILPGFYGIEAGQSAVGDLFKWWVEVVCQNTPDAHQQLTEEVSGQKPGEAGLLALDWNNGNRTILVDQRLTGLILGQTLSTRQAEIYRALIEATGFGARMILERIEEYGVPVERIVCAGGIAEKNPMLMQIYADITGREMRVSGSSQTCALGSAVAASVIAGVYPDFPSAQKAMTHLKPVTYRPIPENHEVYNRIFALYKKVHDAFGIADHTVDLSFIMKELLTIKETQIKTNSE